MRYDMHNNKSRRRFIRTGLMGAAAASVAPSFTSLHSGNSFLSNEVRFLPVPHRLMPTYDFVYASDEKGDPFKSPIHMTRDGIIIPETMGDRKFGVHTRWYVEGFGFTFLAADNGGAFYNRRSMEKLYNLNYEFARTKVHQNRTAKSRYEREGTKFSTVVQHLVALSEELLDDAKKAMGDADKCGTIANKSLRYGLLVGEKIELEKAQSDLKRNGYRNDCAFGCETRQYIWARSEELMKRFVELFNFATITHYVWDSWYELFEPREGVYNWGIKDNIVRWLMEHNITAQGRPLFWFHPWVTPDWLEKKNFSELKQYMESHARNLVNHYGDKVLEWEVFNEYHDWANVHNHTPEQTIELVRFACDQTTAANPKVVKILNNCSLWAEYAATGRSSHGEVDRPLRSPRKFIEELEEAQVDYDVIGLQLYFPYRDLSEIVRMVEKFAVFGKPIYITEIGASSGPTQETIMNNQMGLPTGPFAWHRHWDDDLQSTWMEQMYTIFYSKPYIKAINWYDFADFRTFIPNGGLIRENATPKMSYERLKKLLGEWGQLPGMTS